MNQQQTLTIPRTKELDRAETDSLIAVSNDLILKAQWPRLAINEQRLVLYMLALIEKQDQDFQTYKISVRELVNILGITNKDIYREFDKATDGLMTKVIKWLEPEYQDLIKVTWCYYARLAESRGYVELAFAPELKPFLLALKGHFTIYELRAVIRLKNHYSLRVYQFLKFNQGMARRDGRTSATVSLDWLKEYLGANTDGYKSFGPFKQKVLTPAQKDIQEKTDLMFEYKPIKEGRRVQLIEFFWQVNPDYDQMELPFKPPVEHGTTQPDLPEPPKGSLPPSDEITARLQALGFDDARKVRVHLSDEDWHIALADLDYHTQQKSKSGQEVSSPGGWLRTRLKLSQPSEPYKPTQAYQKHREKEQAEQARAKRQTARQAQRKKQEAERRQTEQRLNERITAKLQTLTKAEHDKLFQEATAKAQDILPEYSPPLDEQTEAARQKLDHLPLNEHEKLQRKAKAEIQKHLAETGSTLDPDSRAGQTVIQNRMLQIVAREYDLNLPSRVRHDEQIERTTESMLRNLVQEKYSLTGEKA